MTSKHVETTTTNRIIKNTVRITTALFATLLIIFVFNSATQSPSDVIAQQDQELGVASPNSQWVKIDAFSGYETKVEPSKLGDGANPMGQNTEINDGDRISLRKSGYEIFGDESTSTFPVLSLHTFRKRDGENIMMRNASDTLQYLEEGNNRWETIKSGYTVGAKFGYADYNINTDLRSYVYFGNGEESYGRWNGAHTTLSVAPTSTATVLFAVDTTGFNATGTLAYCGVNLAYTSKTDTTFIVGSAHACDSGRGISQAVEEFATAPKGNILLNANNRMFIAGIASTSQAVYFSKYSDATNFVGASLVTTSTADSAGIFNLGEGGGAVTGLTLDENSIYIYKQSIIYRATLTDALYTLTPLKTFDGKSQTNGAVSSDSVFTGGNGVFFVTPDKQIMSLERIVAIDYPQVNPISEKIKPTVESMDFASSSGIFFRNRGYFSAKSDNSIFNNAVLVWNNSVKAWESPIIGWSPSQWTIYNDGSGEELYFADALTQNVYKVIEDAQDNASGVTANYRTKRFDFGSPYALKELDNVYIDGYIKPNTELTISLLLDYNGSTQVYTTTFRGTESDYIYNTDPFNLFGFHPFGYIQFGSSQNSDLKRFRVYLNKNLRRTPFFDAQLEFASDGESQAWEVTSYAFRVRESTQPEKGSLYRSW